ncbi:MAG TPA: hypothetical protein VEF04_01255, partial [Blastocatellia bacterium]|nr:hypothetical protein [Blastocatellia bacterium]
GFVTTSAPAGSTVNPVSAANFGSNPGFASVVGPLFSTSAPNSTLTAVSCVDNFWDIVISIGSLGTTTGDVVRLSLQNPGNGAITNLAQFTSTGSGAQLTGLNTDISVFDNNILANGPGQVSIGNTIGFSQNAGTAGLRTNQIVLNFSMSPTAGTMGCFRLVLEIVRAGGTGTTSVAITSIIVNRNTVAGDGTGANATQPGLIGGLVGGFPTGGKCGTDPQCLPACPAGGTPMCPFNMVCFHTPGYYCSTNIPYRVRAVRIPQVNYGFPIFVRTGGAINPLVRYYLGCGQYTYESNTIQSRLLTKYYLAAQISIANVDATSPIGSLSEFLSVGCYLMPPMAGAPPVFPITLSNGTVITADTKFCIVFAETESAIIQMRQADIAKLIKLYQALLTCEGAD